MIARRMTTSLGVALIGAALVSGIGSTAHAKARAHPKTAEAAPAVDANALAALDKMGAELRSHDNFDVKSDITTEDVLGDGQKLQYSGTLQTEARRPNRFKITMVTDMKDREIYYDGANVTIYSPRIGFYASFQAPDTIAKTLEAAKSKYGIELPLADLFAWGTDPELVKRVKAGFFVQTEHVGSQTCDHYAFRQAKADWQIWLAKDGATLPCKLVITSTTDPAQPQYTAVMHWSFPSSISDSTFAFSPPKTAKEIKMVALSALRVAQEKPLAREKP
jgi:hypothetical protein